MRNTFIVLMSPFYILGILYEVSMVWFTLGRDAATKINQSFVGYLGEVGKPITVKITYTEDGSEIIKKLYPGDHLNLVSSPKEKTV